MIVLACDPGKSGAFVLLSTTGNVRSYKCPQSVGEIAELVRVIARVPLDHAIIERVHAFPGSRKKDGEKQAGQGVTSAFTFGQWFGAAHAAMCMICLDVRLVEPSVWQRHFGLVFPRKLGLSSTEKKNRHKMQAAKLFPNLTITHANADALLIARYAIEA